MDADQQKVAAGGEHSELSLRRKKDKDRPPPLTKQPHPSSLPPKDQQKVAAGGGRSNLSLRHKKDKDPSPPFPTNLSLRITPCDISTIITPKASKTISTTNSGEKSNDGDPDAEVLLLEDGDEKELEIDDESAVKVCDAACPTADTDASPKSTDGVLFTNDNKETGPVQADCTAKSGEKVAEDDEAISFGEESEHSESEDTPLHIAMETRATELGVPFHKDLQKVEYPTLWQLTAEATHSVEHFYVPALVPVISAVKAERRVCEAEGPSLAPTLPAVPTIPKENYYWKGMVSPIQQTTEINRIYLAISQLLSDLGKLVGSSLFSDVQIQTRSGSIPAHAVILAARCPKLKIIEQLQTTPACISLGFSDIDDDSILAFLRFIYTGSSPPETDDNVDLRQNFSLLLERWYGDEYGGKEDDELLLVDQESLWLKSASSSQLRNSTVTTANAGRAPQVNVASPKHHGTLQWPESESPQSNKRAHPVAGEEEGENPVIIENSDDSDNSALEIKKSPTGDLKDQKQHTEIKSSAGKAEPKEEPGSSPSKESDGKEEKEGGPAATKKAKTEAAAVEVVDGEESKMEVKPSAPVVKRKTVLDDNDSEVKMYEGSDGDNFEPMKKKTLLSQTKLTLEVKPKTVSAAARKKSAESAVASKKSTKKAESAVIASEHEPTKKPASKKQPPKPVVGKKCQIRTISLSSDEEDDGSPPLKKSPVKEKKRAKKAFSSNDDDVIPPVKKVAAKKSPVKKKAKKTSSFSSSEEGEEDSDIEIQPLRKRVQRQAATRAKNKVQCLIDSSEGEDSDFQPDDDCWTGVVRS